MEASTTNTQFLPTKSSAARWQGHETSNLGHRLLELASISEVLITHNYPTTNPCSGRLENTDTVYTCNNAYSCSQLACINCYKISFFFFVSRGSYIPYYIFIYSMILTWRTNRNEPKLCSIPGLLVAYLFVCLFVCLCYALFVCLCYALFVCLCYAALYIWKRWG